MIKNENTNSLDTQAAERYRELILVPGIEHVNRTDWTKAYKFGFQDCTREFCDILEKILDSFETSCAELTDRYEKQKQINKDLVDEIEKILQEAR